MFAIIVGPRLDCEHDLHHRWTGLTEYEIKKTFLILRDSSVHPVHPIHRCNAPGGELVPKAKLGRLGRVGIRNYNAWGAS